MIIERAWRKTRYARQCSYADKFTGLRCKNELQAGDTCLVETHKTEHGFKGKYYCPLCVRLLSGAVPPKERSQAGKVGQVPTNA